MNNIAPIIIATYSRIDHLRKTIDSLKNNELANKSILYIFSDGPKLGDEKKVEAIRKYIRNISGFQQINIIERKYNDRSYNCDNAMQFVLEKYGKFIWLDDDCESAVGFLKFMNEALLYYKNNNKIFSICGFTPNMKMPKEYKKDYYSITKFSAWGFGTWKDRYDKIKDISRTELDVFKQSKRMNYFLNDVVSKSTLQLFELEADNKIDAFDVRAIYHVLKNNMYSIFPSKSLIKNIGCDGSGAHCNESNKYEVEVWEKKEFIFNSSTIEDKYINRASHKFHKIKFNERMNMYYEIICKIIRGKKL